MSGPLDLVVLTGALGSGKTTLLAEFLRSPEGAGTGVIVNEAGEIGLDGAILQEEGGPFATANLPNGCICCRMGSDLAVTVEALLDAPRPDGAGPLRRIVLETSGLARPGPILRQLGELAGLPLRVAVLSTFDGERGAAVHLPEEGQAQLAGADTVVVTKADRLSPDRLAAAAEEAASANPLARVVADPDRDVAVGEAFRPPPRPAAAFRIDLENGRDAPPPGLSVTLLRTSRVLAYDDLAAWLDNLAGSLGSRLLRLKGLVRVHESERPLLVQSVGTVFSEPRPFAGEPEGASFLVVIARGTPLVEILLVEPDLAFVASQQGEATPFGERAPRRPARAEAL